MSRNYVKSTVHDISQNGQKTAQSLPKSLDSVDKKRFWERWLLPQQETQIMAEQTSKGLFLPYPLLGMLVTIAIVLISGLVALEVQVSNLGTTLLLRDADQRAEITAIKEKNAQLEVYIHNDREKLIDIQTTLREAERPRTRRN